MYTPKVCGTHPRAWLFDRDGRTVAGRFVELSQGTTPFGPRPIVVLDVDGEERSIWLSHCVLRAAFVKALALRHARNFVVGERITIERTAEMRTSHNHDYWGFRVDFLDAEAPDDATILEAADDDALTERAA